MVPSEPIRAHSGFSPASAQSQHADRCSSAPSWTIGLLTFIALSNTLRADGLPADIPRASRARSAATCTSGRKLAMLLAFGPIGILADRIGRRQVFAAGLLFMAHRLCAVQLFDLGPGTRRATASSTRSASRRPRPCSARWSRTTRRIAPAALRVAITGVLNALGDHCRHRGLRPSAAVVRRARARRRRPPVITPIRRGRRLCFLTALVLAVGLKPGTAGAPDASGRRSGSSLAVAFAEARNPRIALAYVVRLHHARRARDSRHLHRALGHERRHRRRAWIPPRRSPKGASSFSPSPARRVAVAAVRHDLAAGPRQSRHWRRHLHRARRRGLSWARCSSTIRWRRIAIPLLILLGVGQISAFAGATTLIARRRRGGPGLRDRHVQHVRRERHPVVHGHRRRVCSTTFGPHAPFVFVGSPDRIGADRRRHHLPHQGAAARCSDRRRADPPAACTD